MDFEAISDKLNKENVLSVKVKEISVYDATKELREELNIDPLIALSENYTIESEDHAKQALSMSMQARKIKKALEESRMKIVRPHIDFQKAIASVIKDYTQKLESIEESLKEKLESWLKAQACFEPNFSSHMIEVEDGKLTTKCEIDFSIENFEKIPKSYLILDEKKVRADIKMGIMEIPGIKIFETKKVTMRVKN